MTHIIKKLKCYPQGHIHWENGAYMSMSINNTVFHNEDTLRTVLETISDNCNSCSIIVGDYLHRYNEELISEGNLKDVIKKALDKGRKLVDLFKKVLNNSNVNTNYTIHYTKDFLSHPQFSEKMDHFQRLHKSNKDFKGLTEYTIEVFLRRQNNRKVSLEKAKELCRLYLFEELVIFEILAEEGYKVNIYPGNQLPIIKAIVTGQLKNVSKPLESIQAIEIKFRPK